MSRSTQSSVHCWSVRRFLAQLALPLCAALAAVGCGGSAGESGGPDTGEQASARNVLLVVLDTTRADRLSSYGGPAGTTPHLDQLAREGVRFERAYSHAPWTLPSTASLLTSLHPEQHGAGGSLHLGANGQPNPRFHPLAPQIETLGEVFAREGWATGAVVNVDFLSREFGLMQGVEHLDTRVPRTNRDGRSAARTTDAALAWLAKQGERSTFLLVHYFDPHAVYAPPADFRSRFADPRDRDDEEFVFGTREELLRLRAGKLELDADTIGRASNLYDGEIAYADAEIGRLLAGLEGLGRDASTVVLFTSDHGEEFLDHGGFEHGHSMYDELLHIPLILKAPSGVAPELRGTVVTEPVRHIDVAPTLCRLTGVAVPEQFAGTDLFADIRRPALSHGNFWGDPQTSWMSGDYKLVLRPGPAGSSPLMSLFNLSADPAERSDIAKDEPETVQRLLAELQAHPRWSLAHVPGSSSAEDAHELSDEEYERLEALGYIPSRDAGGK